MAALRKTLPPNIAELLKSGSFEEITATLDRCEVGACLRTADTPQLLHFNECSDDIVRWAVARGEDINAKELYGKTPLHERASLGSKQVSLLLSLGADLEALDKNGETPLMAAARYNHLAALDILLRAGADPNVISAPRTGYGKPMDALSLSLQRATWHQLPDTVAVIKRLLTAGAIPKETAHRPLKRLGEDFERFASSIDNSNAEDQESAVILEQNRPLLNWLYQLFNVEPAPQIHRHDGTSQILLTAGTWQQQHQALWDKLVPLEGQAKTVQGEAVRISGCVANELWGNGGGNWNSAYQQLVVQLGQLLASGTPLPAAELSEAQTILSQIRSVTPDRVDRLAQLVVFWVGLNPEPQPNQLPHVGR